MGNSHSSSKEYKLVYHYSDLTDDEKTMVVNILKTFIKECETLDSIIVKKIAIPKFINLSDNKYFLTDSALTSRSKNMINIKDDGTFLLNEISNKSLNEFLKILTDEIAKYVNFSSYSINICFSEKPVVFYNYLPQNLRKKDEYNYSLPNDKYRKHFFPIGEIVVTNIFSNPSFSNTPQSALLNEAVDEPI